jgi:acyl carrier protein
MTVKSREEIRALVIDTLAAIAPEVDFATIAPDQPLREQVDIDSFDFLNVIIRLHERLGVDIPEADYGQLTTLDATVDYLAKKCGGAV